jgi:hypothetical protein
VRVGEFGGKTKNQAAGGSVLANATQGWWIWVVGSHLVWGKLVFEGWEVEIYQCVRVGDLGRKKNQAAGAQFSQTNCRGWWIWVVGSHFVWGKLGFQGWEVEIYWHAKVGDLGEKTKPKPPGLSFHKQIVQGGGFQ